MSQNSKLVPLPVFQGNRPLCNSKCPHNRDEHPTLEFSNVCKVNDEAVSPTGGGPCWPAIENMIEFARKMA